VVTRTPHGLLDVGQHTVAISINTGIVSYYEGITVLYHGHQLPVWKMAVNDANAAMQLKEFLEAMDEFAPTIPDELVQFYLQQVGFTTSDPRMYVVRECSSSRPPLICRMEMTTIACAWSPWRRTSFSWTSPMTPCNTSDYAPSPLLLAALLSLAVRTLPRRKWCSPWKTSPPGTIPSRRSDRCRWLDFNVGRWCGSLKEYGVNVCKPEYYSDVSS
jgi:hypothetical protein